MEDNMNKMFLMCYEMNKVFSNEIEWRDIMRVYLFQVGKLIAENNATNIERARVINDVIDDLVSAVAI